MPTVIVEQRDHVLLMGLNRPAKRNAFNVEMLEDLGRAYERLERDDNLRAGVVYAPTTVVALLFAAVLATAHGAAPSLGLSARQVLAVSGAPVALAFVFQWLLGVLRLASVARFLPISVTHGFAAGVGLSMVVGQVRNGFGAGADALWDARTGWHLLAALAVVVLAWGLRRRWPRMPGLLSAVAVGVLARISSEGRGGGAAQLRI